MTVVMTVSLRLSLLSLWFWFGLVWQNWLHRRGNLVVVTFGLLLDILICICRPFIPNFSTARVVAIGAQCNVPDANVAIVRIN